MAMMAYLGRTQVPFVAQNGRLTALAAAPDKSVLLNEFVPARVRAISEYGKPRSILTDRSSPFHATESEKKGKGVSEFERHLEHLGIRHILARVGHPQTNGKLERIHGEIQRKLPLFFDVAGPPGSACPINPPTIESDPLTRFMKWYNHDRPHMSLNTDIEETPAMAFERKMPPPGSDVTDE